ncbi:hypothetical protein STCU_11200 [Strigomonas culicis]|uniref:Uncharacterized protein n=1 Tax=Strigomonas culicis TaxID=28005 RepID=S9TEN0_9TRYP|nr:hypothetical protein STCU_11200 [Strigomonas culicis]|eukprot:EPY16502.1 hypothetical protein STCU_11200 [Strigomonas culicis]
MLRSLEQSIDGEDTPDAHAHPVLNVDSSTSAEDHDETNLHSHTNDTDEPHTKDASRAREAVSDGDDSDDDSFFLVCDEDAVLSIKKEEEEEEKENGRPPLQSGESRTETQQQQQQKPIDLRETYGAVDITETSYLSRDVLPLALHHPHRAGQRRWADEADSGSAIGFRPALLPVFLFTRALPRPLSPAAAPPLDESKKRQKLNRYYYYESEEGVEGEGEGGEARRHHGAAKRPPRSCSFAREAQARRIA